MAITKDSYLTNNNARIIRGGSDYFDLMISMIDRAKEIIHLQTYIFEEDDTGKMVIEALIRASQKKIEIYVIVDGYASQNLSNRTLERLEKAGIHLRFFEPLWKSKQFYFGRRLHQKVMVCDSTTALVGGMNISDNYNDINGSKAWFDFAIYMEGAIANDLCVLCWKTWRGFSKNFIKAPCNIEPLPYYGDTALRMRRNDWVRQKIEISNTYGEMLKNAQNHITIVGSYFLPGKSIRKLLTDASKRGLKITIITAGKSDIKIFKHAERWLYDWLLRRNITIYEYQPTILHAKIALCDSKWLTIGSYNMNSLSYFASVELNIDTIHKPLVQEMDAIISEIIKKDCIEVDLNSPHIKTTPFTHFIRWCSFQFLKLTFNLFTFYYKSEDS
ncbi:MAG: phospholipase [Saprospiraceae bacterium]|nr:phospholipase [Saprospiraceae bacterium]